eukprot:971007_1
MPFTGDIIFDASNSNFGIAEIQALTALGTSLGSDSDGDGVVTLSQAIASDYKFVMVGEEEGIYHVKIQCESESPTNDPTTTPRPSYAPVNHPITAHPTRRPSLEPSLSPVTSEPTTAFTAMPTKRPSATVTDTTDDLNDEREDADADTRAPVVGEAIEVRNYCRTRGDMIRKKTGDWAIRRPQAEIDFERNVVIQWLRLEVKLPQYIDTFVSNGYDNMRAIQAINSKEQLARCGIQIPGHQTLILSEIYNYKARGVVNNPMIEMRVMGHGLQNGEGVL